MDNRMITTAKLANGEIITIDSFADKFPKRKPKVFCNGCGKGLVFKNGKIRTQHFAHQSSCDCDWSNESDLHLLVKLEIFKQKQLDVGLYYDASIGCSLNFGCLKFDEVYLEKQGGLVDECPYKPDIVAMVDGELWWIEVCVTHQCSIDKIKFIKDHDIGCIELKLPKMQLVDATCIADVINGKASISVINSPRLNKISAESFRRDARISIKSFKEKCESSIVGIKSIGTRDLTEEAMHIIDCCNGLMRHIEDNKSYFEEQELLGIRTFMYENVSVPINSIINTLTIKDNPYCAIAAFDLLGHHSFGGNIFTISGIIGDRIDNFLNRNLVDIPRQKGAFDKSVLFYCRFVEKNEDKILYYLKKKIT